MTEILTIGQAILSAGGGALSFGLLASLAIPKFRNKIWGMNGDAKQIKDELHEIKNNHFHTLEESLREIKEQNKILVANSNQTLYILQDLKSKLLK